jgi:hypothetical protein
MPRTTHQSSCDPFASSPSYGSRLAAQWRRDAASLGAYGASEQAQTLLKCASDVEAAEREHALETLTIENAAGISGFSYSSLQKKLASGELENVGAKGSPRVRRGDLPKKGARRHEVSIADAVLARRTSGQ